MTHWTLLKSAEWCPPKLEFPVHASGATKASVPNTWHIQNDPMQCFWGPKKQIQVLPRFFGGKCNDTSSKFIEIWKNTLKRSQVIYIYIVYMHRIPHWISVPSLPHSSTPPPRPPLGGWRPIQSQWSWRCLAGRSTPGPESLKWHRKHPENKR